MGNNFHTPYADDVTNFSPESMNPALAGLDRALTYFKGAFIGCDGVLSWSGGTLTWSGTLHIYFNRTDGQAIHNTVEAGSIALADGEFAYIDLSETNDAVVTVQKAAFSTGAASNFIAYNRLLLGYRNAADDGFYPEELAGVFARALTGGDYLDGREQALTCADNVTIDWSAGATARMTFDRDTVNLTLSNGVNGKVYRLLLVQSAGGSDTISWATSVKWRGGAAPILSTAGNAEDILTFVYINGAWYGDIAAGFAAPA